MQVLIVGCGYVGLALGAALARLRHDVYGMRRSTACHPQLRDAGITPIAADITLPFEGKPPPYDWVVNCVSSSKGDVADYRVTYLDGMRNLLNWLAASPPTRFVYTSSTSVYGQTNGAEVNETSPTVPASETAEILIEAEQMLLELSHKLQIPANILRVAGIYGPERGYWLKQFLKGEAKLEGKGERIFNMVHRHDVVGAIICALERGRAEEIYNVVDDEPTSQIDFFRWLAAALGRPLPPFTEDSNPLRKRALTNKRVSNRKLKTELGYKFTFPSFREGCLEELRRMGIAPR